MFYSKRRIGAALSLCLVLAALEWTPAAGQTPGWGRFEGEVETAWVGNDDRRMRLLRAFTYIDPQGKRWTAPRGSLIDGASIPRPLWTIVGSPFTGLYRDASVIHDYYCDRMSEDWRAVHRMFYNAMRARGVGEVQAKIMFAAVYSFGPRWIAIRGAGFENGGLETVRISPGYDAEAEQQLRTWVEANNPSLEEIESRVTPAPPSSPR